MKRVPSLGLLEYLILVAILINIVSRIVPDIAVSRQMRRQSAAVEALHNIAVAEKRYKQRMGTYGTGTELVASGLVAPATFRLSDIGYEVKLNTNATEYVASAMPVVKSSNRWGYSVAGDAIVRYSQDVRLAPRDGNRTFAGAPVTQEGWPLVQ
jgi:hypothetical protein